MFRVSLWNLIDILWHVDRNPKAFRTKYPNSYLKLPLLKFDMITMFASAPELYDENAEKLMHLLKRKVYKLTKGYNADMMSSLKSSKQKYHADYLATIDKYDYFDENQQRGETVGEDLLQEQKTQANVPKRKQIKAQSARLLEEASRRDGNCLVLGFQFVKIKNEKKLVKYIKIFHSSP
ncbi:uncharacterized protein LOC135436595 isoform X1 [Drosophila montana]|uniref:uncharacterized protein LOC135436595 isoform X1 n=2 Tax=Drosophila montana TaxID=40370 RepID=UPI00313B76C4